jgi:hypothetical protein
MPVSKEHATAVLEYCNEHGETETLNYYDITIDTLHRYQRKARFHETTQAKILLLDIETAPLHGNFWSIGKQYVTPEQIEKDWFILGYSAKWLLNTEMMSDFVTSEEAINRDDKRIMESAWKLVTEADVIIGHNIKRFDMPRLKTRFFLNGMKPPMPYTLLDTLQIAYKEFAFASSKLNYLGQIILQKAKIKTDRSLWERCEKGDQEALDYMEKYCRMDTELEEGVYIELRPWCTGHPNLPLIMDAKEQCCVNCGGFEFTDEEGFYPTQQNRYPAVRCSSCGAINHKKHSVITTEQRKIMLVPNAR